jgi:hypothetical protein
MIFVMKRMLPAVFFCLALTTMTWADNRASLESTEASIQAGHTQISNKTTELESKLKAHDIPAAQTSATNLLGLMREGMSYTRTKLNLQTGDPKKQAVTNGHYLKMEQLTHDFQLASSNVSANGNQLVSYAKSYLLEY